MKDVRGLFKGCIDQMTLIREENYASATSNFLSRAKTSTRSGSYDGNKKHLKLPGVGETAGMLSLCNRHPNGHQIRRNR